MGCFFLAWSALVGNGFVTKLVVFFRMGVGLRLVLDRIEVETWPGSKPRTTLCSLMSVEVLTSEPTAGLPWSPLTVVATVDDEASGMGRAVEGEALRGVVVFWAGGASWGGRGERGSMNFFSCIELTTFSRPIEVMCLPRAWLVAESWRRSSGRETERSDREAVVTALSRLESSEATLVESSGMSVALVDSCRWNAHCGGTTGSGWQQKVSLDQSLHAMFS
jgi:hypothetical protein